MMRGGWKHFLPSRVAGLLPVSGAATGEPVPEEIRRVSMVNIAIMQGMILLGTFIAQYLHTSGMYDAAYSSFIVWANQFVSLEYGSRISILLAWLLLLGLTLLATNVPLLTLALSDVAAFVLTMLMAPVFGFWFAAMTLEPLDLTLCVQIGLVFAIGMSLYHAGYKISGWIFASVLLLPVQPWNLPESSGITVVGTFILWGLVLPAFFSFICTRAGFSVLDEDRPHLNEWNAPVVAFSVTTVTACLIFLVITYRLIIKQFARVGVQGKSPGNPP